MKNRLSASRRYLTFFLGLSLLSGCASGGLPEEHHEHFKFPEKRVYIDEPTGKAGTFPYKVMGWVRSKAAYPTLQQSVNNQGLCKNYYNKAAQTLLKEAEKAGADAVIKVRSVIFNLDGTMEEHSTPECSDDGAEGEVLLRGIAIRFLPKTKNLKADVQHGNNGEKAPVVEIQ
jgi:hypothetical protein